LPPLRHSSFTLLHYASAISHYDINSFQITLATLMILPDISLSLILIAFHIDAIIAAYADTYY